MCFTAIGASAQTVTNGSYSTIGHAQGVPTKWAAYYFFFFKD